MSEQNLFFIDSNPDRNEAPVVTEIKVKNKSLSSTLGAKIEKKKDINNSNKREKLLKDEKNLSNLLFGSTAKPVVDSADSDSDDDLTFTNLLAAGRGPGSEGEEDETSSSEDESESLEKKNKSESEADDSSGDDEKKPEILNEKTESKQTAIDNNDGHDDSEDDSGNTSDSSSDDEKESSMLPEDTFATSLGGGVSRKRKAAWHDEADEKVLVKDVDDVVKRTGTYNIFLLSYITENNIN